MRVKTYIAGVLLAVTSWAGTEVYFSPGDNPTGAVVREWRSQRRLDMVSLERMFASQKEVNGAKSNVLVQAYWLPKPATS